jgi:hypothetical protein
MVAILGGCWSDQYSANRKTDQKEKPEKDSLPIFQLHRPIVQSGTFVVHAW